jgi:anti-sigma B factor antagonist
MITCRLAEDGAAVVSVEGDIDFTNADEVVHLIQDAVKQWSPPMVRVDVRRATFIDSTGLGALIAGYRVTVERRTGFVVVNPTAAFRRVLAVSGLGEVFGVDDETVAPDRENAAASPR